MTIRHKFVSGKAAASDPTLVDGPNWDETHVLDGGSVDQVLTRDPAFDPPSGDGWKWAYPKLRETGGPTTLTPGAIPDGTILARQGSAIVGIGSLNVVQVIDRQVTTVSIVNSGIETDVYRFTVPGGTLGTTRGLRLSALLDVLNNSGGPRTVIVKVLYGATIIATGHVNVISSTQRKGLYLAVDLRATGATNAQAGQVRVVVGLSSLDDGELTDIDQQYFGGRHAIAEDSTVAKDLAVRVQLGVGDFTLRCVRADLELLP